MFKIMNLCIILHYFRIQLQSPHLDDICCSAEFLDSETESAQHESSCPSTSATGRFSQAKNDPELEVPCSTPVLVVSQLL